MLSLRYFNNLALQMFNEHENALETFFRPQAYTQCILESNTECKHNFCL